MAANERVEFGDFQTPLELAREIAVLLKKSGEVPAVIVEPTCGTGSFIRATIDTFPQTHSVYGFDVNPHYVQELSRDIPRRNGRSCYFECRNFFQVDWDEFLKGLGKNVLVIGNPPWVTNSALGVLGSKNLPEKTNWQGRNGFASKTGKANFDISEWMLIKLTEALNRKTACLAMLCKTAIARKTLRHAWLNRLNVSRCSLHLIDAKKHFGVSVDACLLIIHTGAVELSPTANVYADLSCNNKLSTVGLVGTELVADIEEYAKLRDIDGSSYYTWRSGVKHDAASVMEFIRQGKHHINGIGKKCELESKYLFPLLKSSEIANRRLVPSRSVLITQRSPSEDTSTIENFAPKTWRYLVQHAATLDRRRSVIYEKRPRFSVFGIGDYTFSPWKVAISGFYKNCHFEVIGRHRGRPIVVDDTCYFIPCQSEDEARFVCELLNSDICQRFLRSLVFFDAKRPITIDLLKRIDLKRIAERVKKATEAQAYLSGASYFEDKQMQLVFEKTMKYRALRNGRYRMVRSH